MRYLLSLTKKALTAQLLLIVLVLQLLHSSCSSIQIKQISQYIAGISYSWVSFHPTNQDLFLAAAYQYDYYCIKLASIKDDKIKQISSLNYPDDTVHQVQYMPTDGSTAVTYLADSYVFQLLSVSDSSIKTIYEYDNPQKFYDTGILSISPSGKNMIQTFSDGEVYIGYYSLSSNSIAQIFLQNIGGLDYIEFISILISDDIILAYDDYNVYQFKISNNQILFDYTLFQSSEYINIIYLQFFSNQIEQGVAIIYDSTSGNISLAELEYSNDANIPQIAIINKIASFSYSNLSSFLQFNCKNNRMIGINEDPILQMNQQNSKDTQNFKITKNYDYYDADPMSLNLYSVDGFSTGDKKGLSTGAIVGICIGSVVGFLILAGLVYYFIIRKYLKNKQSLSQNDESVQLKQNDTYASRQQQQQHNNNAAFKYQQQNDQSALIKQQQLNYVPSQFSNKSDLEERFQV